MKTSAYRLSRLYLPLLTAVFSLGLVSSCTNNSSVDRDDRLVLGSYNFVLNPSTGEISVTPLINSPKTSLKEGKYLGILYNLGWSQSLDLATGTIRIKPERCAETDYNAESKILTASIRLANQTETGSIICPTGAEDYCNETFKAPLELRIFSMTTVGICDTVCDPACADPACITTGTPTFTQSYLSSINKDSGCDTVEDADSDGFLDCMADDPDYVYTYPDYLEYKNHPTWDYTLKCDLETQDPTKALDPAEKSGCKFLQFTFNHPQLNATNLPILAFSADILGYELGVGLPTPAVNPVTSPTMTASQTVTVILDTTADPEILGDTVNITGGVSEVTCKDNDPCDLDPTGMIVSVSVNLNTNATNNLYVYQQDTTAPTSESAATFAQIVHDTVAPTVASTDPLSSAVDISPGTNILINFNEPVDPATITTGSIKVNSGAIAGAVTLSTNGYTATFNPSSNLSASTTYTVTVCAAVSGSCTLAVKDAAGNQMAPDYTFSFTTASGDIIRPTVISTNPPDNASGISLNSTISAGFSEAIDPTTLTGTNFAVTTGGSPVTGTLSLSVDGQTATFTPDSLLGVMTAYNVTIKGQPTGIKDLYGNLMLADYLFSFTSGASADTDPPTVVSTNPVNLATNVSENINPQVVFSEPIDPTTITTSSLILKKSDETILSAAVSLSEDGLTATLDPISTLENSGTYVLTIGETIADLAGNTLFSPQTIQFITRALPDTTAPTVTTTVPNWYAGAVSIYTNVIVNFIEPLDPNTISTATVKLYRTSTPPCGGTLTPVPGTVEISDDGYSAYYFQQAPPLVAAVGYCITIVGGANGVKDLAGNALAANFTSYFKTADTSTIVPTVIGVAPGAGSTGVPTNTNVIVTFSEPVSVSTVADTSFYLRIPPSGTHIAGVISVLPDKIHARFNPTSNLTPLTTYSFETTNGIRDLSGTRQFTASSTSFTTGASEDTTGPIVSALDPADDATDVDRWQNITVTFNEAVDPTTVSAASLEIIRNYDSSTVATAVSLSSNGLVATINPVNLLNNYEDFTVKVKTSIRNLSGYPLQSFEQGIFTTADTSADTTSPTVQSTVPTCGTNNVSRTNNLTVTMSEPIDPDSATDGWFSIDTGQNVNVIPVTVTIDATNRIITIDPWATLVRRTGYRIYVDHRGVRDYANNYLLNDYICAFTTGN